MLSDKPNCVVTGAGSGLGRAFAEKLAERGASLLLSDVNERGLEETADLARRQGAGAVFTMKCDVASKDQVAALHAESQARLGDTDLLVNNAGVAVSGPVGTIPLEDWEWIVGVNLWGVVYGCHYFLPAMKARRRGHVLNVASIAAYASAGQMAPYNVTKAAVVSLSESLAGELVDTGVGVTVLCPFFFTTNIGRSGRASGDVNADFVEKLMAKTPVQADSVAARALAACERDELYCFPHREAQVLALLKRSIPETFVKKLGPRAAARGKK
jgi:short-subunit dehydrogenase